MNLIITTKCDKGCSFCFAGKEEKNYEMSFSNIKNIINNAREDSIIKILGGEPTNHSDIIKILNMLMEQNKEVYFFSNFLFNNIDIINSILEIADKKKNNFTLVINACELNKEDLKKLQRNISMIDKTTYNSKIIISLTIGQKINVSEFYNQIDLILGVFKKNNPLIRLSMAMPISGSKTAYLHNKDYGDLYTIISEYIKKMGLEIINDCIVLPCMFSDSNLEKIKKNINNINFICESLPFDIMPSGKISYCFPLTNLLSIELSEETKKYNEERLVEILTKCYKDKHYKAVKNFSCCNVCKHYNKICVGPPLCLCYSELCNKSYQ